MTEPGPSRDELLIAVLAGFLDGCRHVAVGALSPFPGSAALLARARSAGAMHVTVQGTRRFSTFSDGGRELFDCAGQGRIDAFFLGGGEIDGQGNVNLVGTGGYPASANRFPGSFGSAYMAFVVPRIVLFREDHAARALVPSVQFISVPGTSPPNVYRRGGPVALVTGKAVFAFDAARARFALTSVHPWSDAADVAANTGFDYDRPDPVPVTPWPDAETIALLRGPLAAEIAAIYPRFAAKAFGQAASV